MTRMKDKVVVVTGAAHGLGRATALRLAAEGAKLVLGDIEGKALARTLADVAALDCAAHTVVGDLTEEAVAAQLIDAAISTFGQIDGLVNNLGGSRNAKIWEMSVEDWDYTLRLNLRGTFLCTRYVAPHMMARRQGRIVCLSSGSREGTPWTALSTGGAAYSVSKAGVHGFIRDVAIELADYNITVNAVAPGPIDTARVGDGLRKLEETMTLGPMTVTPLGRLGLPEEVANAILFLLSDEASYISGHTLAVSGGR
ncbi:MAG: SDR family NAD(P)-dependent oxidoreductase [Alphaproteobacteria bacterium]|nr:SDR family NAD(P)-dependent oxidoreductase [Alphaproteobacteria bacterium]